MEYQANIFASYLLIPHIEFINEVKQLFKRHSITKGHLYLDNQPCNIQCVNTILGSLSLKFNVSKEVVKIRLQNENLLIVEKCFPQRIDSLLYLH